MNRKLHRKLLIVRHTLFFWVIPIFLFWGLPALGVLAIRQLLAPHLSEPVGFWSGIGITYLSFTWPLIVTFVFSPRIEEGMVTVIVTLKKAIGLSETFNRLGESMIARGILFALGMVVAAVTLGEPYNRWDYYAVCWIFGIGYFLTYVRLKATYSGVGKRAKADFRHLKFPDPDVAQSTIFRQGEEEVETQKRQEEER